MNYTEYRIETTVAGEELVAEICNQLGSHGVVFDDAEVNGGANEAAAVFAYFREEANLLPELTKRLNAIKSYGLGLDIGALTVTSRVVAEEDWANGWKKHFHPLHIGRTIVVVPGWEQYAPQPGERIITLDPGMAFGTGQHASTWMCLEAIEERVAPGMKVLDLGCGSGILAIAAQRMGAGSITAVDIDPTATQVAAENMEINEVNARVLTGDIANDAALAAEVGCGYDFVAANIIADVIIELLPVIERVMKPGARCVLSGIIDTKAERVKAALAQAGAFEVEEERLKDEWVSIVAARR